LNSRQAQSNIFFAATIFTSAFLLFLVQPIIAKTILPWFGGSAAVWTSCLVFFQLVLVGGYAYADWITRTFSRLQQFWVHTTVILISLSVLPINPTTSLTLTDANDPTLQIFVLLIVTIGLPYFVLSSTGPLVQSWFASHYRNDNVYRLYALSNIGSLLALTTYPFLIEPASNLIDQRYWWSVGFLFFGVLNVTTSWITRHSPGKPAGLAQKADVQAPKPTYVEQGIWLLYSACGSAMLLSTTNHMTQNVASVPFMWVVPLVIYLVSFILTFDSLDWYKRRVYVALLSVVAPLMLFGLDMRLSSGWFPEFGAQRLSHAIALYGIGLFIVLMYCHGELASIKPRAGNATRFYLMISIGGALGGLFVGLGSPFIFKTDLEFPLVICLVVFIAAVLASTLKQKLMVCLGLILSLSSFVIHVSRFTENTLEMQRSFYGTLRVTTDGRADEDDRRLRLMHGTIVHGEQFTRYDLQSRATTYYHESSGIGRAIQGLRKPGMNVGIIGMGVGTLATYSQNGDHYRFYELDPAVLDLANRHFTFLKNSKADIKIILGDARLQLERETINQFDILAVDAFSGDSIPVHLLTRQAIELYKKHLATDGVIAFHISNRYLSLAPVVKQLAKDIEMKTFRVIEKGGENDHIYDNDWILVTNNEQLIKRLELQKKSDVQTTEPLRSPWTDDYNNLFQILK
jgi:spermidine synthase